MCNNTFNFYFIQTCLIYNQKGLKIYFNNGSDNKNNKLG